MIKDIGTAKSQIEREDGTDIDRVVRVLLADLGLAVAWDKDYQRQGEDIFKEYQQPILPKNADIALDEFTGSIWQHYRNGKRYEIIGLACSLIPEYTKPIVVYKALYEDETFPYGQLWARPAELFFQVKDGVAKFSKVE